LDDAPFRSFDSMERYRQWCEEICPTGWDMAKFEYRQALEIGAADDRPRFNCPSRLERLARSK
jgi:hypothetical protein